MAEEFERASEDLVEKAKADKASKRNVFARIALFIKQVVAELSKVTRPTFKELRNYTGVVLAFVAVIIVVIGLMDYAFFQAVLFTFANNG